MKKTYLSILSLVSMALVFGSCQRDELESEVVGGEVEVSLSAGLPSGLTTYGSSHMGGATNVNADEFDLRYTLEVYDGEEVVYEASSIVPENFASENASFSARLLAKKYKFVLWADFVTNGTQDDLYYNTADLRNISYTGKVDAAKLSDDAVDAYYKVVDVDLTTGGKQISGIKLQRPFGKIRFVATDALSNGVSQAETPASVKIDFKGASVPSSFNALTGEASGNMTVNAFTFIPAQEDAVVSGETKENAYILGYTYFFATEPASAHEVDVTVYSDPAASAQIGVRNLSKIPVAENKLTTVIGNFFTNEGGIDIIVEDEFGNEESIEVPDAVSASDLSELKRLLDDPTVEAIAISSDMTITETITIDRNVTLTGDATITTSGTTPVFTLSANDIKIDGLSFIQNANETQNIITVTANGCVISNCSFEGQYADGNSEVTRAIVPNAGIALTIENNSFKNIRQPGYFEGDGTIIRNNYVDGTRGFVICSNKQILLEGNSFGDNAVDIAIIDNGETYQSAYYDDVRALSEKNNGAFVENQYTKASAVGNGNTTALQAALKNAKTIELLAGDFNLNSGISIAADQTVNGSSRDEVKLNIAEQSGDTWGVTLAGKLSNVSVIYNTDRVPGTAWSTNPGGIQFASNSSLEGCYIANFRNGLYANDKKDIIIKNNIIEANRTGVQFANAVGATVEGNTFRNNETMGVLLQYLSANNGEKPTFTNNIFEGNWFSDFENRWNEDYSVDLTGNTFTADSPVIAVQNSTGEPGSSETFTKPASQVANIVTAIESNVIY